MNTDPHDPRGLIREAFRMNELSEGECRSIFLDWALGMPADTDTTTAVRALIAQHQPDEDAHPMMSVLTAALADAGTAQRRGGRRGRQVE